MKFEYIDNNQALRDFCARIDDCELCALDTEFVREKTYYPMLALIQVATETAQGCIDPLKIDDFSPLLALFDNPAMVKILHAPGQDLELFYHQFECLPRPLFDTQLAAAVLGYANQIGYADLVNRLCSVSLDKKYTRTDWSKRPLSEGELDYAMDDVRYLIPLYRQLSQALLDKGRQSWIEQDLDEMSRVESYQLDMGSLWKRLKGVQKLKNEALNVASQLCIWREQRAMELNRPRRWILKDEDLVDIARFKPRSEKALGQIGNLGESFVRKNSSAIIKVVEEALSMDASEYPRHDDMLRLSNEQQALADCLMAICRQVVQNNDIALASVASKKDLDRLVSGRTDIKICHGWRHEMIGATLQRFLVGELSLRCVDGHLQFDE